ncbi:hypothetical protein [Winogradskyella sp. 3972H.M.0a.05]
MSIRQFFSTLFLKDQKVIQEENERLKAELYALEKLRKKLKGNHSKN